MTSFDFRPDRRHFIQSMTAGIAGLSWPMRRLAAERQWTAIQKLIDGYVADKKMAGAGVAIAVRIRKSTAGSRERNWELTFGDNKGASYKARLRGFAVPSFAWLAEPKLVRRQDRPASASLCDATARHPSPAFMSEGW